MYIYYITFYTILNHYHLPIITSSKRRSNSSKLFQKIGLLKNFTKFTRKHLFRNLRRPATLLKQKFWYMCFL